MKKYLDKLPQELRKLVSLCARTAEGHNYKAYLVGGFVRDLIIGVDNFDLDIVIEGDGIKFAEELSSRLKAKLICHRRFGTATVMSGQTLKVDIASAREECYPHPACLPFVKPGTVKDDLKRRDFSINAMSIGLNRDNYGKLIDFFGGLEDLRNKKIRILHDLSFIDDPTRILRAVRFEKRYSFHIEPCTLKALKEANRLKMLEKVQPQRLRDELILILKEQCPSRPLKRLQELVGLKFINPALSLDNKGFYLIKSSGRQILWFKENCSGRRHLDDWVVYLSAMLDGLTLSSMQEVFKRFVFRKGEEKRVIDYRKINSRILRKLKSASVKPSEVFKALNPLSYETILMLRAKHRDPYFLKHSGDFLESYHSIRIHLRGDDLLGLGIKQGPDFKKAFQKVFNAKLDGRISTKEEELILVKRLLKVKK
ncbi:MAG: CCA tRNA nucleotidyltransferase [Candidatus Omnitrophica bacterium]|nr:CCA tRNA nucleotidyltransferase [Candidatus Omnitrophota bacterium]